MAEKGFTAEEYTMMLNQAMATHAKAVTQNLPFDKTEIAEVVDITKRELGWYTVWNGSTNYEAFSENTGFTYGTKVLVNIPNNDYSGRKTIKSLYVAEGEEQDFILTKRPLDSYTPMTTDLVQLFRGLDSGYLLANWNHENDDTFDGNIPTGIDSQSIVLFERTIDPNDKNNPQGEKLQGWKWLGMSANFRVLMKDLDVASGHYGIKLTLKSLERNEVLENSEIKEHVFMLDTKDMIGSIYDFPTAFQQEVLYNIEGLLLVGIKAEFYQKGDFYNRAGDPVPVVYTYAKEPTEGSYQLLLDNICMSNFMIQLGEDITDNTDILKIYTPNGTSYDPTQSEALNTKTIKLHWTHWDKEQEINQLIEKASDLSPYLKQYSKKRIEIHWYENSVHENTDTLVEIQNNVKEVEHALDAYEKWEAAIRDYGNDSPEAQEAFIIMLNSYNYELVEGTDYENGVLKPEGLEKLNNIITRAHSKVTTEYTVASDYYGGQGWKARDNDITYHDMDWENFLPHLTRSYTEVKCMIVYGPIDDDDEFITNSEDYHVITSNVLHFTNMTKVPDYTTEDQLNALKVKFNDKSGGNYPIYEANSGALINNSDYLRERVLEAEYNSLENGKSFFTGNEAIIWKIPKTRTMITLTEAFYSDATLMASTHPWFSLYREVLEDYDPEYYYIMRQVVHRREPVKITQSYRIAKFLNKSSVNNMITCFVLKNNLMAKRPVTLMFSQHGSSGTDYTFTFQFTKKVDMEWKEQGPPDTALVINDSTTIEGLTQAEYQAYENMLASLRTEVDAAKEDGLSNIELKYPAQMTEEQAIQKQDELDSLNNWYEYYNTLLHNANELLISRRMPIYTEIEFRLFDSKDERIDLTNEQKSSIIKSWIYPDKRSQGYYSGNTPIENDIVPAENLEWLVDDYYEPTRVAVRAKLTDINNLAYIVLKAKVSTRVDDHGLGLVSFEQYLPIHVRAYGTNWVLEGSDYIIYDDSGANPVYYNNPYKLVDPTGTAQDITSGFTIMYDDIPAAVSYYPKINFDTNILSPSPLYVGDVSPNVAIKYSNQYIFPLVIMQNKYGVPALNQWDGSLVVDRENNYVLAAMVGAGHKNSNNTFSGVLMGDIAHSSVNSDGTQTGLFGYDEGTQTFGFNSDGHAFIGSSGTGRIYIDGTDGTITSAARQQYDEGIGLGRDRQGMLINLKENYISMDGIGTESRILIDAEPNDTDDAYFAIDSDQGKRLIHISNDDYYLKTNNFRDKVIDPVTGVTTYEGYGLKIDLSNGTLKSYDKVTIEGGPGSELKFSRDSRKMVRLGIKEDNEVYFELKQNDGNIQEVTTDVINYKTRLLECDWSPYTPAFTNASDPYLLTNQETLSNLLSSWANEISTSNQTIIEHKETNNEALEAYTNADLAYQEALQAYNPVAMEYESAQAVLNTSESDLENQRDTAWNAYITMRDTTIPAKETEYNNAVTSYDTLFAKYNTDVARAAELENLIPQLLNQVGEYNGQLTAAQNNYAAAQQRRQTYQSQLNEFINEKKRVSENDTVWWLYGYQFSYDTIVDNGDGTTSTSTVIDNCTGDTSLNLFTEVGNIIGDGFPSDKQTRFNTFIQSLPNFIDSYTAGTSSVPYWVTIPATDLESANVTLVCKEGFEDELVGAKNTFVYLVNQYNSAAEEEAAALQALTEIQNDTNHVDIETQLNSAQTELAALQISIPQTREDRDDAAEAVSELYTELDNLRNELLILKQDYDNAVNALSNLAERKANAQLVVNEKASLYNQLKDALLAAEQARNIAYQAYMDAQDDIQEDVQVNNPELEALENKYNTNLAILNYYLYVYSAYIDAKSGNSAGNNNYIRLNSHDEKRLEIGTKFYVKKDGSIYSSGGEIAGWEISKTSLTKGNVGLYSSNQESTSSVHDHNASNWRIKVGSRFGVDSSGNLFASNADISGKITTDDITATGGTIGGWKISTNSISSESGLTTLYSSGKIVTGNIVATGGTIGGWSISEGRLSAGQTYLDSAGNIVGANISGGTIQGAIITGGEVAADQLTVGGVKVGITPIAFVTDVSFNATTSNQTMVTAITPAGDLGIHAAYINRGWISSVSMTVTKVQAYMLGSASSPGSSVKVEAPTNQDNGGYDVACTGYLQISNLSSYLDDYATQSYVQDYHNSNMPSGNG